MVAFILIQLSSSRCSVKCLSKALLSLNLWAFCAPKQGIQSSGTRDELFRGQQHWTAVDCRVFGGVCVCGCMSMKLYLQCAARKQASKQKNMLVFSTLPEEISVRTYHRSISDIYSCTSEPRCNCIWPDRKWNALLCQCGTLVFTWHPELPQLKKTKNKKAVSQSKLHRAQSAALESDTHWSDGKIDSISTVNHKMPAELYRKRIMWGRMHQTVFLYLNYNKEH